MWYYDGKQIKSLKDLPENAHSFVYLITNITNGKQYIGKKNLYFERNIKLSKKEISLLKDKRSSKIKKVIKESDWLNYKSSCKPLLEDIAEGHNIRKEILEICFSKRNCTYKEAKLLFQYEVLESDNWYNDNILSSFYSGNIN